MIRKLNLEVIGSTGNVYQTHFWLTPTGEFRSSCTCEGGYQITHCTHRTEILLGNLTAITRRLTEEEVEFLLVSLETTESGRLFKDVVKIKTEIAGARDRLKDAWAALDKEFCRVHFFE